MSAPAATVFKLIYTSLAVNAFSAADLVSLLDRAQSNNAALGVSGLLLLRKHRFMQLIEGPEAAVRSVYQRIALDQRHSEVRQVLEMEGERRDMPNWHMAFSTDGLMARNPGVLRAAYFISPDSAIGLCSTMETDVSAALIGFLQADP